MRPHTIDLNEDHGEKTKKKEYTERGSCFRVSRHPAHGLPRMRGEAGNTRDYPDGFYEYMPAHAAMGAGVREISG